MSRSIEWMNGLLKRAGIDTATGEPRLRADMPTAALERIIAEDKATRWPAIEAERGGK